MPYDNKRLDATLARITNYLLITVVVCFVIGHSNPGKLNPVEHVISQYAASAPWKWLIVTCMVLLGFISALIGFRLAMWSRKPVFLLTGFLLISALNPLRYTGAYPALRVWGTFPEGSWWERLTERLLGKEPNGATGWEKALEMVHGAMIFEACIIIALAMVLFALAQRSQAHSQKAQRITFVLGIAALAFFILHILIMNWKGLLQRLSFFCIFAWFAWLNSYLSNTSNDEDRQR